MSRPSPSPSPEKVFSIQYAGVKNQPHPRHNILVFSTKPELSKQWNLFLQAMVNIYKHQTAAGDINRPLGYYQISGIHGMPFVHWMENPVPDDRPGNYCTHGTALFATWHRPYMLLLEQAIVNEAVKIASGLPSEYTTEAQKIRFPFWDWAIHSDVPSCMRDPKIKISLPGQPTDPVDNPLYSYKFYTAQLRTRDFGRVGVNGLAAFKETKRCPDVKGQTQHDRVDTQMKQWVGAGVHHGMYQLLTLIDNYNWFSNTGMNRRPGPPYPWGQSLEGYHNSVHNLVGKDSENNTPITPGVGHMASVPVSGFDPIFCHTNIDRLYALWQCIHPTATFAGQESEINRLPAPPPTTEDASDTWLRPFYYLENNQVKPWTSKQVQWTGEDNQKPSVFDNNFYYPEMKPGLSEEAQKAHVYEQVRKLYGRKNGVSGDDKLFRDKPRNSPYLGGPELEVDAKYAEEWRISLQVRRYIVYGDFSIFFFIGEPEKEPHKWISSANLVGSYHSFKGETQNCTNCLSLEEQNAQMAGGIDLTDILLRKLEQDGRSIHEDSDKIAEWLKNRLEWRILKENGTELPLKDIKPDDLYVKLGSFKLYYLGDNFPDDLNNRNRAVDNVSKMYEPKDYFHGTVPADLKPLVY